jgi:hypothetical protein
MGTTAAGRNTQHRPAWVNWLFASRQNGHIVIMQWPNWPLWGVIAGVVLRALTHPAGMAGTVLSGAITALVVVWAVMEIVGGVNPFRRGLGALVLLGEAVSVAMLVLHH